MMKKLFYSLFFCFIISISLNSNLIANDQKSVKLKMQVTSKGIINGVILDKYGKRGTQNFKGMPTYSLPISIKNAPNGTVCYAVIIEDKDSIPVCGFSWIHWVATDITKTEISENESVSTKDFVQGTNSWSSPIAGNLTRSEASVYGGMTPPNATHTYEIHVFALDKKMNLQKGFYLNKLWHAMQGHILEQVTLYGTYAN